MRALQTLFFQLFQHLVCNSPQMRGGGTAAYDEIIRYGTELFGMYYLNALCFPAVQNFYNVFRELPAFCFILQGCPPK